MFFLAVSKGKKPGSWYDFSLKDEGKTLLRFLLILTLSSGMTSCWPWDEEPLPQKDGGVAQPPPDDPVFIDAGSLEDPPDDAGFVDEAREDGGSTEEPEADAGGSIEDEEDGGNNEDDDDDDDVDLVADKVFSSLHTFIAVRAS